MKSLAWGPIPARTGFRSTDLAALLKWARSPGQEKKCSIAEGNILFRSNGNYLNYASIRWPWGKESLEWRLPFHATAGYAKCSWRFVSPSNPSPTKIPFPSSAPGQSRGGRISCYRPCPPRWFPRYSL